MATVEIKVFYVCVVYSRFRMEKPQRKKVTCPFWGFHRHEYQRGVRIRLVADWIFGFHCTRSLIVSYSSNALGFSIKGSAHSIGLFRNSLSLHIPVPTSD